MRDRNTGLQKRRALWSGGSNDLNAPRTFDSACAVADGKAHDAKNGGIALQSSGVAQPCYMEWNGDVVSARNSLTGVVDRRSTRVFMLIYILDCLPHV